MAKTVFLVRRALDKREALPIYPWRDAKLSLICAEKFIFKPIRIYNPNQS
ncbi:hypothetical protein HanIR_Chr16g0810001 [Helianthus annuus]|nr:hypothetical protein HanIR_Chr16g0810001 [Helianthus annuus]